MSYIRPFEWFFIKSYTKAFEWVFYDEIARLGYLCETFEEWDFLMEWWGRIAFAIDECQDIEASIIVQEDK